MNTPIESRTHFDAKKGTPVSSFVTTPFWAGATIPTALTAQESQGERYPTKLSDFFERFTPTF